MSFEEIQSQIKQEIQFNNNNHTSLNNEFLIKIKQYQSEQIKLQKKSREDQTIEHQITNELYNPVSDIQSTQASDGSPSFQFICNALHTISTIQGETSMDQTKTILSNLFRTIIVNNPDQLIELYYFLTTRLGPDYQMLETGVGDEIIFKALEQLSGIDKDQLKAQFRQLGDLGLVAMSLNINREQNAEELSFSVILPLCRYIAQIRGKDSTVTRQIIVYNLFKQCKNGTQRLFIVRFLQGNLGIGVREKTIISSLAKAVAVTPPGVFPPALDNRQVMKEQEFEEYSKKIESTLLQIFNVFSHQGEIIQGLIASQGDLNKLQNICPMKVGIPVRPMLSKTLKSVDEIMKRFEEVKFICEFKYDGFRGQIHYDKEKNEFHIFSRNLEQLTQVYPEIPGYILSCMKPRVDSFIIDAEIVAIDRQTNKLLPFQILSTRSRKNFKEQDKQLKIQLCVFDMILKNGESLIKKSLFERRQSLFSSFNELEQKFVFVSHINTNEPSEIGKFQEIAIQNQCEGIMIKTLHEESTYEPSKRSNNWFKLKKDYMDEKVPDSLDLIVIGADFGKGKRARLYGSFLLGCLNKETGEIESVTRIATGFTEVNLNHYYEQLKPFQLDKPHDILSTKAKKIKADVYFKPQLIWEVKASDLTISKQYSASYNNPYPDKGIALRFPRFIRERTDKDITSITTCDQILEFYKKFNNV